MFSWVSDKLLHRGNAAPASAASGTTPKKQANVISTTCFEGNGTFYQRKGEIYQPLGRVAGSFNLAIEKTEVEGGDAPTFAIRIREDGETMYEQPLCAGTQMQYHLPTTSAMWPSIVNSKVAHFVFQFVATEGDAKAKTSSAAQTLQRFIDVYNRSLYIALTGQQVPDDSAEESAVDYVAPSGVSNAEGDADSDVVVFDNVSESITNAAVNTCFADSVRNQRVLVLQHDAGAGKPNSASGVVAQVYSSANNELATKSTIPIPGAKSAKEALLVSGDTHLLVLDDLLGNLRDLDITTGKVVQTFQPTVAGTELKLVGATHAAKYADDSSLVSCITRNAGFVIDTRLDPGRCAVTEEGKSVSDYALSLRPASNAFTCHATSRNGFLAIGDQTGALRLYTGPPGARRPSGGHFPKTAKTLLQCGQPIVALDISATGDLVLVTTKSALLVLDTAYADNDGTKVVGFETRMGKNKPTPLRLYPTPEQILQMGGMEKVSFSSAKFERNPQGEHWVVATAGTFICTWSLDAVRKAMVTHGVVTAGGGDTKQKLRAVDFGLHQDKLLVLSENHIAMQPTKLIRHGKTTVRLST